MNDELVKEYFLLKKVHSSLYFKDEKDVNIDEIIYEEYKIKVSYTIKSSMRFNGEFTFSMDELRDYQLSKILEVKNYKSQN